MHPLCDIWPSLHVRLWQQHVVRPTQSCSTCWRRMLAPLMATRAVLMPFITYQLCRTHRPDVSSMTSASPAVWVVKTAGAATNKERFGFTTSQQLSLQVCCQSALLTPAIVGQHMIEIFMEPAPWCCCGARLFGAACWLCLLSLCTLLREVHDAQQQIQQPAPDCCPCSWNGVCMCVGGGGACACLC